MNVSNTRQAVPETGVKPDPGRRLLEPVDERLCSEIMNRFLPVICDGRGSTPPAIVAALEAQSVTRIVEAERWRRPEEPEKWALLHGLRGHRVETLDLAVALRWERQPRAEREAVKAARAEVGKRGWRRSRRRRRNWLTCHGSVARGRLRPTARRPAA